MKTSDSLGDNIFGERLKVLRKEKGLSLEEIGNVIGAGKSLIHAYEQGKSEPGMRASYKLARFFNVSLDWLIGESEYRESLLTEDEYRLLDSGDKETIKNLIKAMRKK
jgi:transcriptional regulator with XRE-family HTH domain